MNTHLIIFGLSLSGIAVTTYLCLQSLKKRPPVCLIGHSCEAVWGSPYSKTMGIGNDYLGLAFYIGAAIFSWAIFSGCTYPLVILGEYVFIGTGAAMSVYFMYLQWRVIKAWCVWCIFSAFLTWIMFGALLAV